MNASKTKIFKAFCSAILFIGASMGFNLTYAQLKPAQHCPAAQDVTQSKFLGGCIYQYGTDWKSDTLPLKYCDDPKNSDFSFSGATAIFTAPPNELSYSPNTIFCIYHFKDKPTIPVVLASAQTIKATIIITGSWKVQGANLLRCLDSQIYNCPFYEGLGGE